MSLDINALIQAKRFLEENRPPRLEMWVTELMPHKDAKGDPVIAKIELDKIATSAWGCLIARGLPVPKIPTVTNAEQLIMMHPLTFEMMKQKPEFNEMVSGMFAIPVFDDKYRRDYFAAIRAMNEPITWGVVGNEETALLPPADAQRAWLDKILELAIAAGMVTK